MNHKCPHCTVVCPEQIISRVQRFFCRGELRTELDFLLLQRAHFWHHFWFYLFLSLNSGNEVSSVWAVCFSKHFFLLSVSALYSLLVLTKTNKKHTHTKSHLCVKVKSFSAFYSFLFSTNKCLSYFLEIQYRYKVSSKQLTHDNWEANVKDSFDTSKWIHWHFQL